MPAGDGATRVVFDPTCEDCGAQFAGEVRIRVDLWAMFTCHECAPDARENAPLSCTVLPLPRADSSDVVDIEASEEAGFAPMRAPASGSSTNRELPDVICGNGTCGYAIEARSSSGAPI